MQRNNMRKTVIVAHESHTVREAVRRLVDSGGYAALPASDGHSTVELLSRSPAGLVLDVALPGLLAYQVVEEVRRRGLETKIILLASIYNRTGYKRRPTSLYGADDYVEQHHIPDLLLAKLERLIGEGDRAKPSSSPTLEEEHRPNLEGDAKTNEAALIERAERLARLIVTDIALYNGEAFDRAAQREDEAELDARLRIDMEEGRLLFDLRVPEHIRCRRDFIGDALREIRAQRRLRATEDLHDHDRR
jgi:DNA-binding response OmpR family regulator